MTRLEILEQEVKEYGVDMYILLKYGAAIFIMLGGTAEKYEELRQEFNDCCRRKEA